MDGTITVTLFNVSRWPIRWLVGNSPPELWFQPTAEAAAVRFNCRRSLDIRTWTPMAPGDARSCRVSNWIPPRVASRNPPIPGALAMPGNWALRSQTGTLEGPGGMDISVDTVEVRTRAEEWVKNRSSCKQRGACEMEKGDLPYAFLGGLAGFGAGAIAFLLLRLWTRAAPVRIAQVLSVLVVVGVAVVSALLLSRVSGSNDGFLVWGTG